MAPYYEASKLADPENTSPPPVGTTATLASALIGNTDTVDLWLDGSSDTVITWVSGETTNVTLTSTPTLYSHTYTGETPLITLSDSSNITGITSNLTSNFTTTTVQINGFASLTLFINIDAVISGPISSINNSNLTVLNLGNQIGNTALTGDIGTLLNSSSFDALNVNGGELTYAETVNKRVLNSTIVIENNGFSNSEIDLILVDYDTINSVAFALSIMGDNGYATATSSAAVSQMITDGCTIDLNGIPIDLAYTNTGQTFTEDSAITNMTIDWQGNDPSPDFDSYLFGTLPTGLSHNTTTGVISGTPTVPDDFVFVIRNSAYGDTYTGFEDTVFNITVLEFNDVTAPTFSVAPASASILMTSFDITATLDENGTIYVKVVADGAGAPSVPTIIADNEFSAVDSGSGVTIAVTGQTAGTAYDVYVAAEDTAGNDIAAAVKVDVTTTAASTVIHNINFGVSNVVVNTDDPNNKYWNNVLGLSGGVTNIVDEDNNSTTIDVNITDAFAFSSDTAGRTPNDGVYPDEAWDSYLAVNTGIGEITISGLDNSKNYDIILGASVAQNPPNRAGDYIIDGDTITLASTLDPPETITHSAISPTSNEIVITVDFSSPNTLAYLNLMKIIQN